MDSQHSGRSSMEPDLSALIRAELDAHGPRRLPSRFTPRLVPERPQRRRWVLAVAIAVVLAAAAVATAAAASQPGGVVGTFERTVQRLTGKQLWRAQLLDARSFDLTVRGRAVVISLAEDSASGTTGPRLALAEYATA